MEGNPTVMKDNPWERSLPAWNYATQAIKHGSVVCRDVAVTSSDAQVQIARKIGGIWLDESQPGIGDAIPAASVDIGLVEDLRTHIYESNVRCPDRKTAAAMEKAILKAGEEQDSLGGIVEVRAYGVPAGLGDPVFGKIDARLAQAVLSLGAVKGIEFGQGASSHAVGRSPVRIQGFDRRHRGGRDQDR